MVQFQGQTLLPHSALHWLYTVALRSVIMQQTVYWDQSITLELWSWTAFLGYREQSRAGPAAATTNHWCSHLPLSSLHASLAVIMTQFLPKKDSD